MANEIDMWNDIEELEKVDRKMANEMLKIYYAKFIENNDKLANQLREKFEKKYGIELKYW